MHIAEAMLSGSPQGIAVLAGGAAVTAGGTLLALWRLDYERVPQVAMLSATFFVVSLVQVPMGGVSVHLVLTGLVGLILGWEAFPAVLIALLLQAAFFSEGGFTTLGLNTMTMALPAVVCYLLFHRAVRSAREPVALAAGFAAGFLGMALAAVLVGAALLVAGDSFGTLARLVVAFNFPLAVVEGLVTGTAVGFLRKVRPELLDAPLLAPGQAAQ
jgi:cobalt/nickel transport system permease protein